MTEPVSARVDEDIYGQIKDRARENDESVSDIIRDLLELEFGNEEVPINIVGEYYSDLHSAWATEADPDMESTEVMNLGSESPIEGEGSRVPKEGSIIRQFATHTRDLVTQPNYKTPIQDAIFQDSATIHVAGHGSSLSVAHWLVYRLQREGVSATAAGAIETTNSPISADDVVIGISRSGQTDTLVELFNRAPRGATCIAVTRDESLPLSKAADHTVYVPSIDEEIEEYTMKSLFAQVLSLQEVVFDDLPGYSELVLWSAALEEFVDSQFDDSSSGYSIDKSSQFGQITEEMENQGDLALDPLIASTGSGQAYGHELQLKLTEFLHTNATKEHASLVRDRLVNTLYREKAYVLSILPRGDEADAKRYWRQYLLEGPDSVRDLFDNTVVPGEDVSYKLVAMGCENPDSQLVETIKQASVYGQRAYLSLEPDQSAFLRETNWGGDSDEPPVATELPEAFLDLYTFTAIYLFVFAALERRWRHDRQLRKSVIKRVYPHETRGENS